MEAGFDHICKAYYSEFESFVGYQMSAGYPAKNLYLPWSPATSDASQQSLIARQVMEADFGKMSFVDYGLTDFGDSALDGV